MNSSFQYYAWGLNTFECTSEQYKDNNYPTCLDRRADKYMSELRQATFCEEQLSFA